MVLTVSTLDHLISKSIYGIWPPTLFAPGLCLCCSQLYLRQPLFVWHSVFDAINRNGESKEEDREKVNKICLNRADWLQSRHGVILGIIRHNSRRPRLTSMNSRERLQWRALAPHCPWMSNWMNPRNRRTPTLQKKIHSNASKIRIIPNTLQNALKQF